MNFNAIWLSEDEQQQLDLAFKTADAITLLLTEDLDNEID